MKSFLLLLALLSYSASSFALNESTYAQDYKSYVLPLIKSFKVGSFRGVKDVAIHYATYTSSNLADRCLVILPGRTEPLEKYAEVIYDLESSKFRGEFHYFLMDHRGQGSSGRMISKDAGDSEKGHVDDFDHYTTDLKIFMDSVVKNQNCREKILLAHSLGAGIAVDFMQRNPEYFDRAALSSPMLKIKTDPYNYAVARSIVLASVAAGRSKKYAIGQKPFSAKRDFSNNNFTSSPVRYEMAMGMFDLIPKARLGGVTNGWLNQVMKATNHIRKNYGEVRIPMRVFHAGIETYSEPGEMIRLCDEAPYCNRLFLETSKHEVLMDRDINRDLVMAEIIKFFE